MNIYTEYFLHACTIVGAFFVTGFLAWLLLTTIVIVRRAWRDTVKFPFDYKTPAWFLVMVWEQTKAEWTGTEVIFSPKKD